jgi:hypothetical protein
MLSMQDRLAGLLFFVMGLLGVVFYKNLAAGTAQLWSHRITNTEAMRKACIIGYLLIGITFSTAGFLAILGVITFRE